MSIVESSASGAGGGSSTVYYNGTVINRPTDTDKWPFRLERAVSYIPCIAKDA